MLEIINTMKSGTMKGLIVAFVAWAISLSGLAEQFPDAEKARQRFFVARTGSDPRGSAGDLNRLRTHADEYKLRRLV